MAGKKEKWGGQREGAGRKTIKRKPGEKRRAVWIVATEAEHAKINTLTPDERKAALLAAVRAKSKPIICEDDLDEHDTASGIIASHGG